MTIVIKAYANADDVLIAWQPDVWSNSWAGFKLERRDDTSQQVTVVPNRIPPQAGQGPVQPAGISSALSPIRRCIWTDHGVVGTDDISYRVTAMKDTGNGTFAPDASSQSDWTSPLLLTGDAGNGLSAYFNRGTLMSQVVSRFVGDQVTENDLKLFLAKLATPGFPARNYLAGDALHEILSFLSDADRRGGAIHAAIYEINDQQLVDALKPFGTRGHIIIGNGSATKPQVSQQLQTAGLDVHHRDLSNAGRSSPSVHNKFVVESDASGVNASRVLTGSTNWTTTGLCTQLNNMLVVENPAIAARFLDQWGRLVAAGNAMPAALIAHNSVPTTNDETTVYFAATKNEAEFAPVLELMAGAQEGILFLMFMPGQSPLLDALLARVQKNDIYVRGVVSKVMVSQNGDIGTVGGQVVKTGAPSQEFHRDVLLPAGVPEDDRPSWAEQEFTVQEIYGAGLQAIVHSKTIVIDPFSVNCTVITGSHNFSVSASTKNDENLVIVKGNQKLAQTYALHINGVYDHYSWRAYLGSGGDPNQIYKPLDGWKPGGSRAQELEFWMSEPIQPQAATVPAAAPQPAAAANTPSKNQSKKKAANNTRKARPARTKKKKTGSRSPTKRKERG